MVLEGPRAHRGTSRNPPRGRRRAGWAGALGEPGLLAGQWFFPLT